MSADKDIEETQDRYLAKMVRFCAAQQRGDQVIADQLAEDMDAFWLQLNGSAEGIWEDAALWMAHCVQRWPEEKKKNLIRG